MPENREESLAWQAYLVQRGLSILYVAADLALDVLELQYLIFGRSEEYLRQGNALYGDSMGMGVTTPA